MEFLDRAKKAATQAVRQAEQRRQHVAPQEFIELVKRKLGFSKLILATHREPYTHTYEGDTIHCIRSPSGVTIALDSIAQACQALWVAVATGNADREMIDGEGKIAVPPEHPLYTLKRIWIPKELEDNSYLGFANEVLWPLCHVSFVRPRFEERFWRAYQETNRMFAEAILQEIQEDQNTLVFLQDYHLALCGQYIKEKSPGTTTLLFWHIPWPNPEIFRICPWKREILNGLLANDLLGFHLFYHGQNFLETVDMELETRIDWEERSIHRRGEKTRIKAYPIGVDFTRISQAASQPDLPSAISALRRKHRLKTPFVGLGVDRIDYTKGVLERLEALHLLWERYPAYREKLTFIQIGVPSRMDLEEYHDILDLIEKKIHEINHRCGTFRWIPILFLKQAFDFQELLPFYRMAHFCIVTSLHDGMNLVSKEYVASRVEEEGVLILSRFTGAARELGQAILVNPYNTEEICEAIRFALEMPLEDQKNAMGPMRTIVQENDIYSWASQIIHDLTRLAPHVEP